MHLGFASLKNKLARKLSVRNPGALAASIGRKKLGFHQFETLATKGRRRGKN